MKLYVCLLLAVVASAAGFECPKKDGQYPDPVYCDKFYECEDEVATEKLCPDGLLFDPLKRFNKCDYPINVQCEERSKIAQEKKHSDMCPRKNGYFPHPDTTNCHSFVTCIQGAPTVNDCPPGLVFAEAIGVCTWPASAGREGCVKQEKLDDGFKCPEEQILDRVGNIDLNPRFPHPSDCQKFYICLNQVTPREHGCPKGRVFNIDKKSCDKPENVEDCKDWYKDNPVENDEDGDDVHGFDD